MAPLRVALFGLAALALGALAACAPARAPEAGPALWRIADADGEIYLFGTVHVLRPGTQWRTPRIERAFARADTVVFETQLDGDGASDFRALVRAHSVLPAGETLSAQLDDETRARLARLCQRLGVDPQSLERTRPWLVAMQLSLASIVAGGGSPAAGVEAVLGADARRTRKRMEALETPREQVETLATLQPDAERALLAETLRQIERHPNEADLQAAWIAGDLRRLDEEGNGEIRALGPAVYEAVIVARNRAWTEKIDAMRARSGVIFVAVGAAHLTGPDSVVSMLRARGIAVEGP